MAVTNQDMDWRNRSVVKSTPDSVTPKKFNGAQVRFRGFAKTRTIYFSIPPKEERQNVISTLDITWREVLPSEK